MKALRIASLALGILAVASGQTSSAPGGKITERQLHVRLYNLSNVPPTALRRAATEVARIFRPTKINVIWEMGVANVDEAFTTDQSSPIFATNHQKRDDAARSYIVVRIGRGMAKGTPSGALGSSLPNARHGVSATIFHERIESLCDRIQSLLCPFVQQAFGVVLGHVIAHELGHVLLGSGEHASEGIMRANWGKADFDRAARGHLGFTALQAAAIRDYASRSPAAHDERQSTRLADSGVTTSELFTNALGR
jgi:hypothetical protein